MTFFEKMRIRNAILEMFNQSFTIEEALKVTKSSASPESNVIVELPRSVFNLSPYCNVFVTNESKQLYTPLKVTVKTLEDYINPRFLTAYIDKDGLNVTLKSENGKVFSLNWRENCGFYMTEIPQKKIIPIRDKKR